MPIVAAITFLYKKNKFNEYKKWYDGILDKIINLDFLKNPIDLYKNNPVYKIEFDNQKKEENKEENEIDNFIEYLKKKNESLLANFSTHILTQNSQIYYFDNNNNGMRILLEFLKYDKEKNQIKSEINLQNVMYKIIEKKNKKKRLKRIRILHHL